MENRSNERQQDQAANLRGKVIHHELKQSLIEDEKRTHEDKLVNTVVDVLNLPPRHIVHQDHQRVTKYKLSKPLFRFFFMLLLITAVIIYVIW